MKYIFLSLIFFINTSINAGQGASTIAGNFVIDYTVDYATNKIIEAATNNMEEPTDKKSAQEYLSNQSTIIAIATMAEDKVNNALKECWAKALINNNNK